MDCKGTAVGGELAFVEGNAEKNADARTAYADVLWALLNTKEYMFNH